MPVSETAEGEFAALLTTVKAPAALPAVEGAKVTGRFTIWPAPKLKGSVNEPRANPPPLTLTCETVTAVVPVLVRATA